MSYFLVTRQMVIKNTPALEGWSVKFQFPKNGKILTPFSSHFPFSSESVFFQNIPTFLMAHSLWNQRSNSLFWIRVDPHNLHTKALILQSETCGRILVPMHNLPLTPKRLCVGRKCSSVKIRRTGPKTVSILCATLVIDIIIRHL